MASNVYEIVNDKVLELLAKGTVPWNCNHTGQSMAPRSFATKREYRGINWFLLNPTLWGFTSPYWLTFNQCSKLGGRIKAGEKSHIATFWKFLPDPKDPTGKKKIPFLRYFRVFNLDQTEGLILPETKETPEFSANVDADTLLAGWKNAPTILHNGGDANFYRPSTDTISMVSRDSWKTPDAYYSTLFHECVHATGHPTRLGRAFGMRGTKEYAREELIAEMGSAYLASMCGFSANVIENQASYLAFWSKALTEDPKAFVTACGAAQRAVDSITGFTYAKAEEETVEAE